LYSPESGMGPLMDGGVSAIQGSPSTKQANIFLPSVVKQGNPFSTQGGVGVGGVGSSLQAPIKTINGIKQIRFFIKSMRREIEMYKESRKEVKLFSVLFKASSIEIYYLAYLSSFFS